MRTIFRNPHSTWLKLTLLLSLLVVLVLVGQQRVTAVALELANVAAPDINCFFDLDCSVTATDFSDAITLPGAAGSGFLQSRMLPRGETGTPGADLYPYEYRIDIRNVAGITHIPCITQLKLPFGPVTPLNYDDSDRAPEHVYVVTQGGLGSVAPVVVDQTGDELTFFFDPPICAGQAIGFGESSYFFGLASPYPPRPVRAAITATDGSVQVVEARAPNFGENPDEPTLRVVPERGPAGLEVLLIGAGYAPGGYPGTIRWNGEDVEVFDIPEGGAFETPFVIPPDAQPGTHVITVCALAPCATGEFEQSASAPFEVTRVESAVEEDFFYALGKQVPVEVHLDQIGVAPQPRASREAIIELLDEFGLQLVRVVPDNFLIFSLGAPKERPDLAQLAREVKAAGMERQLVLEAGLLMNLRGDPETPMFLTDEFIALFGPNVPREAIDELNAANKVEIVAPDPYVDNQFLLRVTSESPGDALTISNRYEEARPVDFAHPNYWTLDQRMETIPSDPLFGNQWHHRNTGASGGATDADADTSWAWDITTGNGNTIVAIIDDGFDIDHEDLAPNLYTNPAEIPGNGIDDDGNGYVDDVNGWDFATCSGTASLGCGDNNPRPGGGDSHGTAVAGVAAARGNNGLGVSGSCPTCSILPIRRGFGMFSEQAKANTFAYAQSMGADVINNSWGHTSPSGVVSTVVANAINNAAASGALVIFSAGNANSAGWCAASYTSLNASVMAVSSATNLDTKAVGGVFTGSAIGACVDILAPSYHGDPGTLGIATTDRTGAAGYNAGGTSCAPAPFTDFANNRYTNCFGGTSSAAPLTAGVAGLVRSANTGLTPTQTQRLLQDTADKIEPGAGAYGDTTGFSTANTHSYGRLNAFEAVRVAAPVAQGGKGGVDVFVRDNRLDWGNTTGYLGQQNSGVLFETTRGFIPWWHSMDIKVDAPPYQPAPTTSTQFDAFMDEAPISGATNRVYVRVHNRGPVPASAVTVKLHYAFAGTALPPLPPDFWSAFPGDSSDTSQVVPVGVQTIANLGYSGASVAGTGADASQIVQFSFVGPSADPTDPAGDHYCLFVVVDSAQDPIDPQSKTRFVIDQVTTNDNNITHRNYRIEDSTHGLRFRQALIVRNPYPFAIRSQLLLEILRREPGAQGDGTQDDLRVVLEGLEFNEPFSLEPFEELRVFVKLEAEREGERALITIMQENLTAQEGPRIMGGMTYELAPLRPAQPAYRLFLPLIVRP